MKKLLSIILVSAVILSFAACGKTDDANPETTADTPKTEIKMDINAVLQKIIDETGLTEPNAVSSEAVSDIYFIDIDDISECAAGVTMDGTFPDEVIIIKAANDEAKERIKTRFNERLDDVKVQSQNYDAENYALAQECKVSEKGDYIALFISDKHAEMEKIFETA